MIVISTPDHKEGIEGYTSRELRRMFHEHLGMDMPTITPRGNAIPIANGNDPVADIIVLGTRGNNAAVRQLMESGFLTEPTHPQGYSIRCGPQPGNNRHWLLAIAGGDAAGALYALRDLEHYHMDSFLPAAGGLAVEPFERREQPAIEYRGHWVWGCNMPDKPAWIENMSRWKLNELIHWDNSPPQRAREYVAFAHQRGVRVVWGFGWGWVPGWNFDLPAQFDPGQGEGVELCPSSEFNLQFFRREILRKVHEDYAPTGCDGIYFQAFTECPKCQCPRCANRSMGELMLRFVNPIVDAIKRDFPDLWISCGIHHDFGEFSYLRDLDARCNIFWENCESGTSLRGQDEDFGYIHKSIPYGHGYGESCPSDPPYTEESLQQWMQSNADRYVIEGGLASHYQYLRSLQNWGRRFLGKRSQRKHASMVADHSVFCRRTPFPHVALAEAQWDPDRDTEITVDGLLTFLGMKDKVEHTPETGRPMHDPMGKPPWLCDEETPPEGHAE